MQDELELSVVITFLSIADRFPGSPVPKQNRSPTVFAFGDCSFKTSVGDGVIFNLDGEPLDCRIKTGTFGHGPTLQNAIHFKTKIIMQM